jgi:hypothetical protein
MLSAVGPRHFRPNDFIAGSSRQTSALGTVELALPSALLAVAVLRTVRHVLRIGRDVRSIQSSPGIKKT